jgi:hypothetical protein
MFTAICRMRKFSTKMVNVCQAGNCPSLNMDIVICKAMSICLRKANTLFLWRTCLLKRLMQPNNVGSYLLHCLLPEVKHQVRSNFIFFITLTKWRNDIIGSTPYLQTAQWVAVRLAIKLPVARLGLHQTAYNPCHIGITLPSNTPHAK